MLLALVALAVALGPAAANEPSWLAPGGTELLGPGLAGTWYDRLRGLWLVVERTAKGYRLNPVLLERNPDGQLSNRLAGLVLEGALKAGILGFRGEGAPAGDPQGRTWLIEGSLSLGPGLEQMTGDIRIETKPYPQPPLNSRPIRLLHCSQGPTLSVFQAGEPHPAVPPPPTRPRDLPVDVELQYLKQPGGVAQEGKSSGPLAHPSSLPLTSRGRDTWTFNRNAAW
jgi:hypothetical protein